MKDHDIDLHQTHYVDRSRYARGPWDDEPDRVEWRDDATGLPCLIVRQCWSGHLCGYVGVPPGHPLHGVDYDRITLEDDPHGGLTYANACAGRVCHIPQQGEPDTVWWLGFDCAHGDDVKPTDHYFFGPSYRSAGTYKTVDFVKRECAKLAKEIGKVSQ